MTEADYNQELKTLQQKKQDGIISPETFKNELYALNTIYGKIPRSRQCPTCLSKGEIKWGTYKIGDAYYCKDHKETQIVGKERPRSQKKSIKEIRKEKARLSVKILKCVNSAGAMTRNELVLELDRARTTIYEHLRELELKGYVISEKRKRTPGRGRAQVFWSMTEKFKKFHEKHFTKKAKKAPTKKKPMSNISRTSSEKVPTKKKPESNISRSLNKQPTKKRKAIPCPNDPECPYFEDESVKCLIYEVFEHTVCGENPPTKEEFKLFLKKYLKKNETLSGLSLESSKRTSTKKMEHD